MSRTEIAVKFASCMLIALAVNGCAAHAPAKDGTPLTGTYWKLTELMGQPVKAGAREAHLIFKEGGQVGGSGGCNHVSGSYETKAPDRIRFTQMISTMMACLQGMETERGMLDALERADSYTLTGNALQLNRARMAPLARFEASQPK